MTRFGLIAHARVVGGAVARSLLPNPPSHPVPAPGKRRGSRAARAPLHDARDPSQRGRYFRSVARVGLETRTRRSGTERNRRGGDDARRARREFRARGAGRDAR
eukprot:31460-Pelagococcus_subviridis.AAC.2